MQIDDVLANCGCGAELHQLLRIQSMTDANQIRSAMTGFKAQGTHDNFNPNYCKKKARTRKKNFVVSHCGAFTEGTNLNVYSGCQGGISERLCQEQIKAF